MKKVLIALFTAALILNLVACSNSKTAEPQASASKTLLEEITERGEIIIATEGTYAPWTYHDEQNNLVGYDIEVATAIAEKLGVKASFVEVEWDGIFAGLDSKRYDIVANEVEITPERSEKYDFSTPYAYIHTAIIVKGDNDEITSFEDLNGKTTANTLSSTYAQLSESYGGKTTGVDDLAQTMELVLAGRVDATLNADVSYYDYMNVHPEANLKIAAVTEESVVASIPVRKGEESASLLEAINQALVELDQEGVLSELSVKYFGNDVSKEN